MLSEQDQNCILEVEESINLSVEPLQPPPYDTKSLPVKGTSSNARNPHPVDTSMPVIDGDRFIAPKQEDSKPINEFGRAPVDTHSAEITPLEGVVSPGFIAKMTNKFRGFLGKSRQSSQQEEGDELPLQPKQPTLIISLEREGVPVFNLLAWLGDEERGSTRTIYFQCVPGGKLKEIQLSVKLSDPGASISGGISRMNPKSPRITNFSPRDTKTMGAVDVKYGQSSEAGANVGAGAFGATGGVSAKVNHDMNYTLLEGSEIRGLYGKDMTEVHWNWTASNLPGAVLKDKHPDIWLEVENVKDVVKAGFRVVCKVERSIINVLQSDIEAPKKQKPRINHVVTKLNFKPRV